MKNYFLVCLLVIVFGSPLSAQLKSPEQFLGYQLGEKYTPHYKIVSYFQQAANAASQMMQLQQYGETNESRPLLLAIITSPENLSHIEEIRKNNLRLAGLLKDKPGNPDAPAIVWLSYNVHGNEASSSEAAMKTLYELVNPSNTQTKGWLKNTIVIIDPCLNPDGRDRYVNWFTQMAGKNSNPALFSREHNEPWPGGRVNHYNFDLNRDWAWQTQLETQQRLKIYNEWLPHIHCDYHEQGVNNPYYFAPAAEPYHEVITPWQRQFQTTIGRNHAKYFDQNGWLYFTKEIFDLLYPSYGDTYPTFNGAIGMTYEQAGGPAGGLMSLKNDGDTLTLKDRILHHFTTSMSTIEITSLNAGKLVKEFKKFFDDAISLGAGEYKSFIVTSNSYDKLEALQVLLARNNIEFGSYQHPAQPLKGYNYFTGKEETIATDHYTIAINTNQPKGTLARVLFEPRSKISDSATYDITAWSLPYAYGLKSYALKNKVNVEKITLPVKSSIPPFAGYGYLFPYNSFKTSILMADFLKNGIKVRIAENGFAYDKNKFSSGTLIVLRKGNENKIPVIEKLISETQPEFSVVQTGFMEAGFDFGSEKVHFIKKPNVVLITGKGVSSEAAGEVWHLFDQQLNYPISLINAEDFSVNSLKNTDVLILPNGSFKFLTDKDAAAELKNWVKQGGKLIAMENAAVQIAQGDWGLKIKKPEEEDKKDDKKITYNELKKYENRDRDDIVNNIPGAIYKVGIDNSHPLAFGYPDFYFTLKQNDNLFEFLKEGWNVGVLKKDLHVSGFVGSKVKEKIKDGTVIGVVPMGNGSLIFFADDPIFRSFWENGKQLFSNAVFLVGQ